MKKNEIQIGAEYAERRGSIGGCSRVRILAETTTVQGYGYSRKKITAWRVAVLDPRTGRPATRVDADGIETERVMVVPSRQIVEPWVDYAEREAAARKARLAAEDHALRGRQARAKLLLDLIPAMRHAGLPDTETRIWDRGEKFMTALDSAGLVGDIVTKDEVSDRGIAWGDQWTLRCPLSREIEDFVVRGDRLEISAEDLLSVLK